MNNNNEYYIYTDGSCKGNPGDGGWAFLILDEENKTVLKACGSEGKTTNQRMEMKAVIESLKQIEDNNHTIYIFSDSAYIVNCFKEDWLGKWKEKGWINSQKKEVKNKDLWKIIDELIVNTSNCIYFEKVKGHSNNPHNNEVDRMAQEEAYYYKKTNKN